MYFKANERLWSPAFLPLLLLFSLLYTQVYTKNYQVTFPSIHFSEFPLCRDLLHSPLLISVLCSCSSMAHISLLCVTHILNARGKQTVPGEGWKDDTKWMPTAKDWLQDYSHANLFLICNCHLLWYMQWSGTEIHPLLKCIYYFYIRKTFLLLKMS